MRRKKLRLFYIPNIDLWRWERLTDTYLKVQLERVRDSIQQTELTLDALDRRVDDLGEFVRDHSANPPHNFRTLVESEAKAIKEERKRVTGCQERLVLIADRMQSEIHSRRINSDRRLPA